MSTKQFTSIEKRILTDTEWTIIKDNYDENGNNTPEVLCGNDPILKFTPIILNADGTVSKNVPVYAAPRKSIVAKELADYCKKMNITTTSFRLINVYYHVYEHHVETVLAL